MICEVGSRGPVEDWVAGPEAVIVPAGGAGNGPPCWAASGSAGRAIATTHKAV